MQRLISIGALIASIGLAGCTIWAPPGKGGAAEDYPSTMETTELEAEIDLQHELRQDLNHVQRHLDVLAMQGADDCLPASVHEARLRENRIAREISGGLYTDAETGLTLQRLRLNQLELRLDTILSSGDCSLVSTDLVIEALAGDSRPKKSATESREVENDTNAYARLSLLLNSDNQFALNSDRINPKYAENLRRACAILVAEPNIRIEVIGHTDVTGKTERNLGLSALRAEAVVEFLAACDIDPKRITRSYRGDQVPLFPGNSPSINLVNRRVSVDLILDKNLEQE